MKIIKLLLVSLLMLTGCTTNKKEDIKVLVPSGAPALSLISEYDHINEKGEVKIVEGSDLLSAELVKADSQYDVIIAPINLGCQLIAKKQTDFKLAGVVTWGNLYVVTNKDANDGLAAFGEKAVPGKMLSLVHDSLANDIKNQNIKYYNAVTDVQAQMLSGKVKYGLMAEPAATATIAKAKKSGMTLSIACDIQDLYQKKTNSTQKGYPQAAVFVKNKADTSTLLEAISQFTNGDVDTTAIKGYVDKIKPETLGLPSSEIVVKTWQKQNISYKDASEVKDDIQSLLKQFNIEFNEEMLAK